MAHQIAIRITGKRRKRYEIGCRDKGTLVAFGIAEGVLSPTQLHLVSQHAFKPQPHYFLVDKEKATKIAQKHHLRVIEA